VHRTTATCHPVWENIHLNSWVFISFSKKTPLYGVSWFLVCLGLRNLINIIFNSPNNGIWQHMFQNVKKRMQNILYIWRYFICFALYWSFVSAFFVHQVIELAFIFCEMKREDIICGTTAWHLCILYLCVATVCTDLTPVYAQGMIQAGMAWKICLLLTACCLHFNSLISVVDFTYCWDNDSVMCWLSWSFLRFRNRNILLYSVI
jgi:hypothetical protein